MFQRLFLLLSSSLLCTGVFAQSPYIQLNQIGFFPKGPKIAAIINHVSTDEFHLVSVSGDTVFTGKLSDQQEYAFSEEFVRRADFSRVKKPGTYHLFVKNLGRSWNFEISDSWPTEVLKGSIKALYYQRASLPLYEKHAGSYAREAGHPDDEVLVHSSAATSSRPENTKINGSKGWYDAGDYNKYIVNSGITCYALLAAYEDFPALFDTLSWNIPESSNELPDLLDETLWNLRWMLTMQDTDGGVYHKLTHAGFSGFVQPKDATKPRYVVQKSTAATLDFAAVFSQAARIFRAFSDQLPGLADSCQNAALHAWQWAQENPKVYYRQKELNLDFKPAITTGEYGDNDVSDEFFWAGTELAITMNDPSYLDQEYLNLKKFTTPSWPNVATLGWCSLVRHQPKWLETEMLREKGVVQWEDLTKHLEKNPYHTVMGTSSRHYHWGCTGFASGQVMQLSTCFHHLKIKEARAQMAANVDWLLGRNATTYSFVTQFGSKTPMHIHHRPSGSDEMEHPVPGLIAGGPGHMKGDECDPGLFPEPKAKRYLDMECSYSTNEIAINWQGPLVYALASVLTAYSK